MKIDKYSFFKYFIIPQSIRFLFSGLRLVASIVIALIVIAEMYVGEDTGVGGAIATARESYNWLNLYGLVFITGLLGVIINATLDKICIWTLKYTNNEI